MVARIGWVWILAVGSAAQAQPSSPGHVNYVATAGPSFDSFTYAPDVSLQQWMQSHFSWMVAYTPYFNRRTSWYPNAYAYVDLYAVYPGSWQQKAHPEWILRDEHGNPLYIPFGCADGTCPQFAGDISNPEFRADRLNIAASRLTGGNYAGLFIDDVNLQFRVSDGWGNAVAPMDSSGQPMTFDAWRESVAIFLEEIRAALPDAALVENAIWYAGPPGIRDADPAIRRQIATATTVALERGVASDPSLTGGTGQFSLYAFFNYIDRIHAAGKGVSLQQHNLDRAGQQYGLASYFLISNGTDSIGDDVTTPDNWWPGYDIDLGTPLGPRTYTNGIFERDFRGGKVLLADPGLPERTVGLRDTEITLNGTPTSSVTLAGGQGIILVARSPTTGIVNAASLTGAAVSPGEFVSALGSFSAAAPVVLFNGARAAVTYVGPKQVNAVVPFGIDLSKPAQVEIRQGSSDMKLSVPVAAASPALFTTNATGSGHGAILNQDYSVNSASTPAPRGSVIMLYGTGFGALREQPPDGKTIEGPAATAVPVSATIGGMHAAVEYAGAAPGFIAGLMQINVRVPEGLDPNPAALVSLTIGSATTQAGVTVAIQ